MNKRANKKAFFIILCIGLMYLSIAFNLTERFTMKRTFATIKETASAGIGGPLPTKSIHVNNLFDANKDSDLEPGFLVAVPLITKLVDEDLIEKEGLLFIRRSDGSMDFKKPVEVLKDKDENGMVSIAEIVGRRHIMRILKSGGIIVGDDLGLGDIILGRGYVVRKNALIALYSRNVSDRYTELFPFSHNDFEVRKNGGLFEIAEHSSTSKTKNAPADTEWTMPDLSNLTMRSALQQISGKTSKIKLFGAGYVMDQNPKPYEKLKGEVPCSLYGRPERQ